MRITKLLLENFRCFDSVGVDFHPEFNVFIGNNASGKTALLEAIAISLSEWTGGFSASATRPMGQRDIRRVSKWYGNEFTSAPQFPGEITVKGKIYKTEFSWSRIWRETDVWEANRRNSPLFGLSDYIHERPPESADVILPVLANYGIDRLTDEPTTPQQAKAFLEQADMSRMEGYRDALDGGRVSPRSLVLWLEYQDWIAYKQRHESPLYIAVREAMTAMIPNAKATEYDPKTGEPITIFDDGSSYPFSELSEGQRCMAALAGDIAIRMARLNPRLGESLLAHTPGIILIDELDLHLHPQWQRQVASLLRQTFPLVQFITTTHSPQIVGEVQPECVSVLQRGDYGSIRITKPVQSYGLDTNGILGNLMGTAARPALVQNKIDAVDDALEEGEWERARGLVSDLRSILNGDDPETARLDASTYAMEALADAVD